MATFNYTTLWRNDGNLGSATLERRGDSTHQQQPARVTGLSFATDADRALRIDYESVWKRLRERPLITTEWFLYAERLGLSYDGLRVDMEIL